MPFGSEVKQVDHVGQFRLNRRRHYISKALAGREVGVLEVEQRMLVYYRRTLICELDPLQPRSIPAGDRQPPWPAGRV